MNKEIPEGFTTCKEETIIKLRNRCEALNKNFISEYWQSIDWPKLNCILFGNDDQLMTYIKESYAFLKQQEAEKHASNCYDNPLDKDLFKHIEQACLNKCLIYFRPYWQKLSYNVLNEILCGNEALFMAHLLKSQQMYEYEKIKTDGIEKINNQLNIPFVKCSLPPQQSLKNEPFLVKVNDCAGKLQCQPSIIVDRQDCIKELLMSIEPDTYDREGLKDTPKRVAKMYNEIFGGYNQDPIEILGTIFKADVHKEMVIVKDISFYSHCEHHMVPFFGLVHIGYIPQEGLVGISKLARLVECFARRLQIQERLTTQIASTIDETLNPLGVMVVIEAEHLCMKMRGIKNPCADTITSAVRGVFKEDDKTRAEFISLISKKR